MNMICSRPEPSHSHDHPHDHQRPPDWRPPVRGPRAAYQYRPRRAAIGVMYMVVGLAFLLESLGVWEVHVVDIWPLLLIAFGTAVLLGRARRIKVDEDRSAQLAVAEERVRIARELHDIVAHSVSLMTIQIAAARRVSASQPEAADRALSAAEETGRRSLSELRGLLALLRGADASIGAANEPRSNPSRPYPNGRNAAGDPHASRAPLPSLDDLEQLVDGARQAGLDVSLVVSGDRPALSSAVELAVYRVVQEALTNVIRHAGPVKVSIELTYTPEAIVLFVDDEGTGVRGGRTPEGGHGLLGMKERIGSVGGSLEAGPRVPGPGWRVHANVPLLGLTG